MHTVKLFGTCFSDVTTLKGSSAHCTVVWVVLLGYHDTEG